VLINDLLQFKFHQAAMDSSRIVFNTTFGIVGLFDVASRMELPKHTEDFGQTLGYWGVGEGYYLVLPLLGPSTVRDTVRAGWGLHD
jgi:phospholipid-binding lipoprotein MlaA